MITEPKEKPILFFDEMVRAILDGRKTQTRRVIPDSFNGCLTHGGPHPCPNAPTKFVLEGRTQWHFFCSTMDRCVTCPYGEAGDRLWVREAWRGVNERSGSEFSTGRLDDESGVRYRATWDKAHSSGWKPSIHMPRWASRITLEVTDVRVERVQEIDALDALTEGVTGERVVRGTLHESNGRVTTGEFTEGCPRDGFRNLWDSINAKRGFGWDVNPWVWVITFKRIEP